MWVSGSGKTTVLNASWIVDTPTFLYVQSYTTRPLREWEVNGEKYHHIDKEVFQQGIQAWEFLERATVHQDYLYGTKYLDLVWPLEKGVNTIKEIDMYGLLDIIKQWKIDWLYTTIFLDVPEEVMLERIRWRGDVSDEEVKKRIESSKFEREQAKIHCDYIIDASQPLEKVVEEFTRIIWVN